jgi:hypothetical protein
MAATGRQAPPARDAQARRRAAIWSLMVDGQTAEVVPALEAAGVPALLLKGPAIARALYAEDEGRFYGDTDVLVAPSRLAAAERTLRALGYERVVGDRTAALIGHHGSPWRRPGSALEVDLHRTLTGVRGDPGELWLVLWEHSTRLQVQEATVRVPDVPALALHVALHAAQHGIAREMSRRDLEHALGRLDVAAWRRAAALAERVDAIDAFGVGLRLLPAGEALAAELGLPPNRWRNAALRAMAAPSMTLKVERLRVTPGARAKARLLVGWMVPAPDFMRISSPMARKGRAGLLLAYLCRPLVIAGRIVPAVRAWRRAARTTTDGAGS